VLIFRIKRCQAALSGGRLDEAVELLEAGDLRAHRQGQELTDRVVAALIERGRMHLAAGRVDAAVRDCDQAAPLAGNSAGLCELRQAVSRAVAEDRKAAARRDRTADAVLRLAGQGQFSRAAEIAARAADREGSTAGALVDDLHDRRASFERCLADGSAAAELQDWESAMRHLARARSLGGGADVDALARSIGDKAACAAQGLIESGRLDAAELLLRPLSSLCQAHGSLCQVEHGLSQLRLGWTLFRDGRHDEAREVLARLPRQFPAAQWLKETLDALSQTGKSLAVVRGGPLGLIDLDQTIASRESQPAPAVVRADTARLGGVVKQLPLKPRPTSDGQAKPVAPRRQRLLLHVDGSGCYVVILGDAIDIGPISASRPPDLPLMTSPASPAVTLCRSDEDYFLNARVPVALNQRPVTSALLGNGDQIGIGPRCRIEFRRPNAASGSAVLRISGARLPWPGVREVLLMDRELVIGPGPSAHVRTREGTEQLTIQISEGRLLCRCDRPMTVDGTPAGTVAAVAPGNRVEAGALSFAIQPG